jgi:hypothetical protein
VAIGLKDIKNPRKEKKDDLIYQKDKVLRPWEAYESLGVQTRTVSAQEAVKRAKLTVQKNNEMVENLKKNSYNPKEKQNLSPEEKEIQKGIFNKFLNFLKGIFYET